MVYLKKHKLFLFIVILLTIISVIIYRSNQSKANSDPQYQTSQAYIGNLIVSISGSGTITSGNSTNITTAASGTVSQVYVKNGDVVKKGQKIADISLDAASQSQRSSYYIKYLKASEAVEVAKAAQVTADIQMWQDHQAHLDALDDQEYKNNNTTNPDTHTDYTETEKVVIDKTVDQTYKLFKASELEYNNSNANINNAKVQLSSAWQDYQEYSPAIIAPTDGVINNLSLAPGFVIENQNNSTNDSDNASVTVSGQTIGTINNQSGQFQAVINLSEIDITQVKADQKVNLTLDAFPDKTFTGKVLYINTNGAASSGVTNYPVTVLLDSTSANIYPKMAVNANIITHIESNVLLVPSTSLQSENGQYSVRILKDGLPVRTSVEIGVSNDSETVIKSGLAQGDTVISGVVTTYTQSTNSSSQPSPFNMFGGSRSPASGGSIRGSQMMILR